MDHYKGFIIFGGVTSDDEGSYCSYGLVCMKGTRTLLEIKRIEGTQFRAQEAAEQHGMELCKLWIDEHESK